MAQYVEVARKIIEEVKKAVIGKDECVKKILAAILAGGHILIEDIPGVGKTTMAVAFAKSMTLIQNRVQFTPDVLPADITGFSMYDKKSGEFYYEPGAVMCNLLLADEINRTSPKTQSALLEVMEEGTVTIDKVTREVPHPFIVIATENPIGSAEIVKGNQRGNITDSIRPILRADQLVLLQKEVENIYIHDVIYSYIGELVTETRKHPMIELGISPRGTVALAKMTKAIAYLNGRNYCVPKDVQEIFENVARHRIQLNAKARLNRVKVQEIIEEILNGVQAPNPKER